MDTTNVITADSLKQQKALTIPTFTPSNIDLNAISTPITTGIANDYTALQKQLDLANQQQTKGAQEQVDIMQVLTGRTADLQQAQEQAGVSTETANLNKYAEQLANLNAQASALNREAQAIPIQIEQESQGRGRTVAGVAPLEASRLRENALKALSIGQQADIAAAAATGSQLRLNAAKEKAQQAVDLKYKPLEEQLAIRKQQYELNKDILSSIDKKRTESLNAAIKREETALAEKKANEKAVSDMMVRAASQNAPQALLARAQKAKTPTESALILGQYAGDYWAIERAKAEVLKIKAEANAKAGTGVAVAGTYKAGSDPVAESWAKQIADKKAKLTDVPSAMRTRVVMAMGMSPEQSAKASELKAEMKTILERMQGYKGIATGPKAQMFPVASQVDLPIPFSGTNQTSAALADAERLSALLTTENIAIMKGLGSMSNIEFGNIEKIGSSILGRDKDGNAYFKGDRANYDREVQRLLDDINGIPQITQNRSDAQENQSKWSQGDTQSASSPLSDMAQKGYINPKSSFGTVEFNLPTKP